MRIVSTTGASHLTHHGVDFEPDDAGIFEVPEHVGAELTAFPIWLPEHVAVDRATAEQAAHNADPARTGERVAALESRVADLEAALAELLDADADDADDGAEGAEAKPKRRSKTKADEAAAE